MLVAIATLIMMFGGGGSLENYLLNIKKPVKAAVESKVTVNEVLDLSKVLKKGLKAKNQEITKLRENFLNLHKEHHGFQDGQDTSALMLRAVPAYP